MSDLATYENISGRRQSLTKVNAHRSFNVLVPIEDSPASSQANLSESFKKGQSLQNLLTPISGLESISKKPAGNSLDELVKVKQAGSLDAIEQSSENSSIQNSLAFGKKSMSIAAMNITNEKKPDTTTTSSDAEKVHETHDTVDQGHSEQNSSSADHFSLNGSLSNLKHSSKGSNPDLSKPSNIDSNNNSSGGAPNEGLYLSTATSLSNSSLANSDVDEGDRKNHPVKSHTDLVKRQFNRTGSQKLLIKAVSQSIAQESQVSPRAIDRSEISESSLSAVNAIIDELSALDYTTSIASDGFQNNTSLDENVRLSVQSGRSEPESDKYEDKNEINEKIEADEKNEINEKIEADEKIKFDEKIEVDDNVAIPLPAPLEEESEEFEKDQAPIQVLLNDAENIELSDDEYHDDLVNQIESSKENLDVSDVDSEYAHNDDNCPIEINEDEVDEKTLKYIFNTVSFESSRGIRKGEFLTVLKQVFKEYKSEGHAVDAVYDVSPQEMKKVIDLWYSKYQINAQYELEYEGLSSLITENKNLLKYFAHLSSNGVVIEKDVNIWDELLMKDNTITYDTNGDIATCSLNHMIERLTMANTVAKDEQQTRRRILSEGKAIRSATITAKRSTAYTTTASANAPNSMVAKRGRSGTVSQDNGAVSEDFDNFSINYILSKQIQSETMFKKTFYYTYRNFTTPEILLEKLFQRFDAPSYIEPNIGFSIQMAVLEQLHYWVKTHPKDFSVTMSNRIQTFLNKHLQDTEFEDEEEQEVKAVPDEKEDYEFYVKKLIHEIRLKNVVSIINLYYLGFSGADLVVWIIRNVNGRKSVRRAIQFAEELIVQSFIHNIKNNPTEKKPFRPWKTDYYQITSVQKYEVCLNMIINEAHFYNSFLNFAKQNNEEQNLLFIRHVDEYKDITDAQERLNVAQMIFDTYLSKSNKQRLKVESKIVKAIDSKTNISTLIPASLKQNSLDSYLFDEARNVIYYEVNDKQFKKYKVTKEYEDLQHIYFGKSKKFDIAPPYKNKLERAAVAFFPEPKVNTKIVINISFQRTFAVQSSLMRTRCS
jgi:hypothetical protein